VSDASGNGRRTEHRDGGPQTTAIADVSERFTALVHEEIELAKAEVAEKTGKLARGAVVAVAAGIFLVTALIFVLIGLALLLYYVLPVAPFAYFWGFFAMAAILIVLGIVAGLVAAKVVKRGAPPTPEMAIEEARKIRESISAGGDPGGAARSAPVSAQSAPAPAQSAPAPAQSAPAPAAAPQTEAR
jgi:MFS family permease